MIPQYFVRVEKMPHTPNGKIDRKALPEPETQENNREIIKPRNKIDRELVEILQQMLQIKDISILDQIIDLGGDSLTAITLSTKILSKYNVQINIKDILSNYTIKDMSDFIKEHQSEISTKLKIDKAPKQDLYPLSSAQKRIYYSAKMIGEDNTVYNMPGAILVEKVLDRNKIKRIFEKIVERHSTLRTAFVLKEDNVMQKVFDKVDIEVPVYENTENQIEELIKEFSKPFNLEKAPLIRAELHYIDNKKTLILVESHHIVMDGTGLSNLIKEFSKMYNNKELEDMSIEYKDYAIWENNYNTSEEIKTSENYWLDKFKDTEFTQLDLPYDYKIPANRSYKGSKLSKVIDKSKFNNIEKYAKKLGISPYMLFISAFFILLYKYTGQDEIILGTPTANRNIDETKKMIGMFVNNIVVKGQINPEESIQEFFDKIKQQVLDDLSNQSYPFDMLVKKLEIVGDKSRNPLFDLMFIYQNEEENIIKLENEEAHIIEINNNISKFNLSLEIKPNIHTINIEYCTALFKKQTMERLFEHYMNVLECIINNEDIKIKDISIISKEEKNKIRI